MENDYYQILEISKSASVDEIKKSYKTLALKYHPDKNKTAGAEEKFKKIAEAYEVLTNEKKRKAYEVLMTDQKKKRKAIRRRKMKCLLLEHFYTMSKSLTTKFIVSVLFADFIQEFL